MSETPTNQVSNPSYTCQPDEVIEAEKARLGLAGKTITGLAISGGGIRSASFGLGVMQAMVAQDVLSKVDYLSTVSGGGYIGSALTWALKKGGKEVGTSPENFPLGKKISKETNSTVQENADAFAGKNNKLLNYIRQHASYLTPTSSLDIISFAGVVIRGMSISLLVYFSFLSIAMTLSLWLVYQLESLSPDLTCFLDKHVKISEHTQREKGLMLFVGIVILAFIFIKGFVYSLSTYFRSRKVSEKRYALFLRGQTVNGTLIKFCIASLILGSLPFTADFIGDSKVFNYASGSTLYGVLVGLWRYKKAKNNDTSSGPISDTVLYTGVLALFYGVLLLAYLSTDYFLSKSSHGFENVIPFVIFVAVAVCFGLLVDLNLVGPHNLWRSRLMEAFLPNPEAVNKNSWMPATEADKAHMEDMCDEHNPRPYHIINTNIILANSPKIDVRSRGGDNFIVSPLYCGSDSTGWRSTSDLHKKDTRGITLATAMATSAAALNPNAGVSGAGFTRNYAVSILLAMLNLRLGYWTLNPDPSKAGLFNPPNFFKPGVTGEILRTGLTENNKYIQLSDGGHFENLAMYELIRRQADVIIVSDGGADHPFNFDDLANAIEKVRVDFGVSIKFSDNDKLDSILPGSLTDVATASGYQKKYEMASRGYAVADIFYPGKEKCGKLVYIKLAIIDNLPTDIYSYKGVNPMFPHESTADQFFNEKQFEAYRELGYRIGKQMLASDIGKEIFKLKNTPAPTYGTSNG